MRRSLWTFALLVLLIPVSAAQDVAPVRERAEGKAAHASSDPVGFARGQASPEGLSADAEWGRAYVCDSADDLDVEAPAAVCPVGPDVQAVPEEPVAEAVPFTEEVVAQVEAFAEDVVGQVEDLVDEAPAILLALVDLVRDLVGALASGASGTLAVLLALLADLALASAITSSTGLAILDASVALFEVSGAAISTALGATLTAEESIGSGLGAATDTVIDGVLDVGRSIDALIQTLLGRDAPSAPPVDADPVVDDPADAAGTLVGDVLRTVDGAAPV